MALRTSATGDEDDDRDVGAIVRSGVLNAAAARFTDTTVAQDGDPRNICGLPPIYVLLRAVAACEGRLLKYAQAADPSGHSCVSFAAMAFY